MGLVRNDALSGLVVEDLEGELDGRKGKQL
jgi:hypothetical protein